MNPKFKIGDSVYIKKNAAKIMYPRYPSAIERLSKYENQIHIVTDVNHNGWVGGFHGCTYQIKNSYWFSEQVIGLSQIEEILEIENIL